jgi:hypothetical protein
MAVISTIASISAGCGGSQINTGELGCDIEFGLVIHALAFTKGFSIPAITDVNLDYMNTQVQAGNVVPLMDAFSSEPTFAEDTLETSPLGVEALTLKGLPKYMLTMKKGQYYYKEMAKATGFGNLTYVLGDVNGNWKFARMSDGSYGGFSSGQTIAMMTTPATATETEKKSITFQLTDRNEIDTNYDVILAANLFPISQVTGVNAVTLSYADSNGAAPIAIGDTEVKVKAVFAGDGITGVEGLAATDLLYSVDAVAEVPSLVEDGNGFYTLTVVTLAASTVSLRLYDGSESVDVVIVSDVLLRSNTLSDVLV